jgi:hypothetical protein
MLIRLAVSYGAAGALAMCLAAGASDMAQAQVSVLKECSAQLQAAKAESALKGQDWQDFLRACRARLAELAAPAEALAASGEPNAQSNVFKECSTRYQAAKAADKLGGQSWQDYLKFCRAHIAEPPAPAEKTPVADQPPPIEAPALAPASPSQPAAGSVAPAPAPATAPAVTPGKPISEGKAAEESRQKRCAAKWKAQKAELKKTNPDLKWPQYWIECNKRLKASAQ